MSLFLRVEHPYFGPGNQDVTLDPEALATLSSWRPESLLATLPAHDPEAARRDQLRLAALAQSVESYSSLKRRHGGYQQQHAHQQLPDEQELRVEAELVSQEDAVSEDDLPGGVRTGLFLHELLETLDPASLTRYESFEEWGEDPDVLARFQRAALEHGLEPHLIPLASRVIWRALNAVVQVEHGVIYGLGHCLPNTHELEFLYPIPEAARDHLTSSSGLLGMGASASGDDTAPRVERGFIKGYIDYVFMWQGRIYLADWKSDLLDRYDPISLRAHFEHNYIKQGYLYSLAICKLLQINTPEDYAARFGCAVYCFLRGMQDDSSTGLVTWRPSWSQLQDFARALTEPGLGQQRAHLATPATHPLASRSS